MKLSSSDLHKLAEVAITAAERAGEMISRSRPETIEYKADAESLASQVVTEVDRAAEAIIIDMLSPTVDGYGLGVLSEEQPDDGGRLTADYFWCIDPIDGTLPFIEGTAGYAVSIGLVRRDGAPQVGVVYDPAGQTIWHAIAGAGVFRDRQPWSLAAQTTQNQLSMFADKSFLEGADHDAIMGALRGVADSHELHGVRVDASAGAVMNGCKTLENPPACYFKRPTNSGGGSLWDFAAIACLFQEAGAVATDMHGAPLDLNREESTLMCHRGVLFATDAALAERIRAAI